MVDWCSDLILSREIFEGSCHAPIYAKVEEFNRKTLAFLRRHAV